MDEIEDTAAGILETKEKAPETVSRSTRRSRKRKGL